MVAFKIRELLAENKIITSYFTCTKKQVLKPGLHFSLLQTSFKIVLILCFASL